MAAKTILYLMVAVIAVAAVAVFIVMGNHAASGQGGAYVSQPSTNGTSSNGTATLFSSTQYAQFAYLISGPALSSQAQAALSGFNLTRTTYQNGSVLMTVRLLAGGSPQSVLLKPGYKMYIIETSFGDDSFGGESNLGDDGFVVVNPAGYVA